MRSPRYFKKHLSNQVVFTSAHERRPPYQFRFLDLDKFRNSHAAYINSQKTNVIGSKTHSLGPSANGDDAIIPHTALPLNSAVHYLAAIKFGYIFGILHGGPWSAV
jgi:hypothetical protein